MIIKNLTHSVLLTLVMVGFGLTSSAQISTYPYSENFDAFSTCSTSCSVDCDLPGNSTPGPNEWSNDRVNDDEDWIVDANGTSSSNTGPSGDHTSGTGNYLYTETSGCSNIEDYLLSPVFDMSGLTTPYVQFWYHMLGATMGTMHLDVSLDGGTTFTNDFFVPGWTDNVDMWQLQEFCAASLSGESMVQFRIRGLTGTSFTSDMAIDDFSVSEGGSPDLSVTDVTPSGFDCSFTTAETVCVTFEALGCTDYPGGSLTYDLYYDGALTASETADPGMIAVGSSAMYCFTATVDLTGGAHILDVTVTSSTDSNSANNTGTSKTGGASLPYFEDFDSFNTCSTGCTTDCDLPGNDSGDPGEWSNDRINDDNDWIVDASGTGSFNTGPSGDHTSGGGNYLYTEASGCSNDEDYLLSPIFDFTNVVEPRVSFWYHMFGSDMGTMHFDVSTDAGVTFTNDFFEPGWTDNVDMWQMKDYCATTLAGVCGVQFRIRGLTGPSFGSDMAIDDFSVLEGGLSDINVTDVTPSGFDCAFSSTETVCVTYQAEGCVDYPGGSLTYNLSLDGSLVASEAADPGIITAGSTAMYCFTATADLSGGPHLIEVEVLSATDPNAGNNSGTASTNGPILPYKETFDGFSTCTGSCTIDCDLPGNISGSVAEWSNDRVNDDEDWIVDANGTGSLNTGPSGDHTSGSGNYLYTEASSPCSVAGVEYYVLSPIFDLKGLSLPQVKFWYHMFGGNMGTMHLDVSTDGGVTFTNDFFEPGWTDNQDLWQLKNICAPALAGVCGVQFRIRSITVGGTPGWESDMAIDDFEVFEGPILTLTESSGAAVDDGITCPGDAAVLSVTPGFTYLWSTGETTSSINVNPTTSTTYDVTVSPAAVGCSFMLSTTVTVDEPGTPIISLAEACLEGTVGQCSYSLVAANGDETVTAMDPNATTNELDGYAGGVLYTLDVVNAEGCTESFLVEKPKCDCNSVFDFNPMISDPCVCNNDQSANGAGDGTFSETVVVTGTCGFSLFADAPGQAIDGLPFIEGSPDPVTGLCDYTLTFNHTDGIGYNLCVIDAFGNAVTGSGSGMQLCISNVCEYPVINEPVLGPFCADAAPTSDLDMLVMEVDGDPGDVTVSVDGMSTTTFDPSALGAGPHTILWTFTGSGTGSSGGTAMNPAYPGCTTSYATTVTVNPLPELTVSDCICDFDPNIGNIGSQVTLSVANGTAPYTVTVSTGTLTNSTLVDNQVATLYLGVTGGNYTIDVVDANGCSTSYSSACQPCEFSLDITDPCSCNNDQDYNGAQNGTFAERIDIQGPSGLNLIVGAGSTGLIGFNVGDAIPEVIPGLYRLSFDHVDVTGYTLFVEGTNGGVTFPINDANGNQLVVSNACQYPVITEPNLDILDFCNNGTPLVFDGTEVTEINGFDGIVRVYVNGQSISEFDPTQYANGFYVLRFEFTGTFVDNLSTGGVPAFPGCVTNTFIQVGVGGGGQLTCNDHVNISVNNDCEVDFSWSTLLEDDYIPDVFDAEFTDSAGNVIDESDLGSYAGSTLTYSIIDMCNGNSCWGTMQIDDKTVPTVDCDCPVGGETGVGDYAEECTLTCWELPLLKEKYWDRLRDNLVPEMVDDFLDDHVTSTCDDVTEDDISYYDVYVDLGPCSGTLLRRTWTVTYDKGNDVSGTVSCTREYFFQPVGIETLIEARRDPATGLFEVIEDTLLLPPRLVELTCGADISPAGIAAYFDNPGTTDNDTNDDRIDPDELDIDVVIENNEGVPYGYPHYYIEGRNPSGPHAQPIDNEVCNIIVAYTDQEIEACAPGCSGNRKVLRTWTVLDWCNGQFVEHEQVIKSIDTGAPSLVVHDVSASVDPWKCAADVALPHPEHIYDDCETITAYSIGTVEGALSVSGNYADGYVIHDVPNGETITVEYLVEDCCGNIGRAFVDVSVVDLTPPVPVTKEFIVLSLANIGNPVDENQGVAKLYAQDVDNGSYDGCTGIDISIRRVGDVCDDGDLEWGDHVKFCCEDLDGQAFVEIDVEFRVVDAYGNTNYAWSTIRLEDKSSSTQTCPDDMVLTCDMDWNDFTMTGLPQAFSACGEIDLMCDLNELIEDTEPRRKGPNDGNFAGTPYDGVEVPAYDPSCGFGAVRRQFKSCSSCTQWFVIEPIDAFNPNTITFPADIVVDCDAFETGEPDWEPATCNLVGVSLESDTFLFEDGACYKILNHWSVINWCTYDPTNPSAGGKYDHTQVVKIIDTQDPVMTAADSLCFSVDVDCVSTAVELSASANDEGICGSEWLKWEVTIDLNSDWTSDMYFGTDLPRIVNGVDNPYYIAPTGNDELATITLPAGLATSNAWHRAVWRVYDGCGNNVSTVRYFQITDKKAPTPYCLNLSTAVMSTDGTVELWAIDFNVGSFDNCTDSDNLLFTFTDVAPPGRDDTEYDSSSDLEWYNGTFWYYDSETGDYEDQDDYGDEVHRWEPGLRSAGKVFTTADADASGFAQIPIYVWDANGNNDFCLVNLRIIDNMGVGEGRIAGQILTEEGEEVEGVMTELMSDSPEYPLYNMTDEDGKYSFNEIPMSVDYAVRASKNDDYLNGVSTLDLLLIQRHILGQEQLSSAYKMIAADVNNDNDISTVDMIELRKLILGVYDELPSNNSWKAVDATQALTTANPWIYKESLNINDLQAPTEGEDFIGVKIGDVNASADANFRSNVTERSSNVLELLYADGQVEAGEVIEVVMTSGDDALYGYQFTMDLKGMELVEVRGSDISEGNVAVFEDRMTMSYNSLEALNKDGEIFTMVLKATESGLVSEMIGINSGITKAEAYVGESLDVVNLDMRNVEGEGRFALYQNQPNPFTEYTVIGYEIPTSGEVTISFYDVTGRVLNVMEKESVKGYNEVRVNRSELGASGMIYYKLESKEHTATQHMMLIE